MVSIIMPVYNASKFLKEAIDSILGQTFKDFELIIINDGSTDNSEAIVKSYTDNRIRYVFQANQGVAKTLNNGIQLATKKYIWRHDADDISLPTKLEEEFNFLEQNTDVALCACQVAFMTERGKVAWDYRQPKNDFWNAGEAYKMVTREGFSPYCPITHGTVLVRTDVMRNLDGYRTEFITGEDVDAWLRLIQQYKAVVLNRCLSLHRLSSNSATQVHGWKNEFFRNLSFQYYEQRASEGKDDLQKGIKIVLPATKEYTTKQLVPGKTFRGDLLDFSYPLCINAKDWKECFNIIRIALKDGWKLSVTWKTICFPFIGNTLVKLGVKLKKLVSNK
ncbi:glycosyltransferase family 2 protein [Ferruginibacter sp. SUN002]|uniref:glycosyltransferase family 2 protein n=1 Tax=Ferruginibacter sp. SUN002 TaxID=2937789 RepID=UPI003D365263